jgi:D-ribose pyranose/furanose isomerase RbsD
LDVSKIKLPIAVIFVIVAQAFGLIWYMAQLDSTVATLTDDVAIIQSIDVAEELSETLEALEERLDDIETEQAVILNEYRTIMADHSSFKASLKSLNQSSLLPTGEQRSYGAYD